MAKAYDRMSWSFIVSVLNKFDFSMDVINLFMGTISNVWHSIILNGTRKGFFTSTQGFKQGDPLSPSLFIISAEVLSGLLNNLIHSEHFLPFSMPVRGPVINHFLYADNIVIFTSGNTKSIRMIKKQIHRYEKSSGQRMNAKKCFFLTAAGIGPTRINKIRSATGFLNRDFLFEYLGCAIYIDRKRPKYFEKMLSKVIKRLGGWQSNMLSYGGKMILIKHVLQSPPIYTLTALTFPKSIAKLLEKHFARFFWGASVDKDKYSWSSWKNICFPKDEGGLGVRNMSDICETLNMKK
ncbi:hypothetical protein P3L10_012343 [Capsicum annuum]